MKEKHKTYLIFLAYYFDGLERTKMIPQKTDPIGYVEISDERAFKISENLKEIVFLESGETVRPDYSGLKKLKNCFPVFNITKNEIYL